MAEVFVADITQDLGAGLYSLLKVRRGLAFFLTGKVLSGLLGLCWLAALVRVLDRNSLGVYLAVLSIFEVGQLFSSIGLYSFVQRYLPQATVSFGRRAYALMIAALLGLRIATLLLLAGAIYWGWNTLAHWQGWSSLVLAPGIFVAFILLEGMIRFLDAIFECVIQQGYSQCVSVARNLVRLGWVGWIATQGERVTPTLVIQFEAAVAACFVVIGLLVLARAALGRENTPGNSSPRASFELPRAIRFSWNGYVALALGQLWSQDTFRLLVGHFCGSAAVATYGLAQAVGDIVKRYMPMQLLLGFARSVMIARFAISRDSLDSIRQAALLHKVNAFFLTGVAGWAAACGAEAMRVATSNQGFGESGPYLAGFMVLICIQALRMVLALMAVLKEDDRSILVATAISCSSLLVALISVPAFGPWAAIISTSLAEGIYIAVLAARLQTPLTSFLGSSSAYIRLVCASAAAAILTALLPFDDATVVALTLRSLFFCMVYLALLALWRPFSTEERAHINRLLPFGGFIW